MGTHPKQLLLAATVGMAVWASQTTKGAIQETPSSSSDIVLGTWNLVISQSTYSPGPAPKNQVRIYEADPNGIRTTIKTTDAEGHTTMLTYTAKYDGVDYPITGSPDWDAIALKKISSHVAEAVLAHAGKEFGKARRVISPDQKTMTITFDAQVEGKPKVHNVAVFEKQQN